MVAEAGFTLLSRPGCHLCEEFREELEQAFGGRCRLVERCVDDRPDWRERFGRLIPVLLAADGAVVCESRFDAACIAAHLDPAPPAKP